MGQMMEQKTEFVESLTELVEAAKPDPVMRSEPNMNFWPLLLIAVIAAAVPVLLTRWFLKRKKK